MARFRFAVWQIRLVMCRCSAWQLLAASFTVEKSKCCGSAPGAAQTQHRLTSLRNNDEIVSNSLFTAVADRSGDTPDYPQLHQECGL